MPGLIDMHVHIRTAELEEYLPAGVTSVRNMWGYNELPAIIADVEAGRRKGPRIFSLTAGFDGSPAQWPQTQLSDDPTLIAPLIDHQYELGFREIKIYQRLTRAAYDTIVAIAHRKGMTFAGHMPHQVGLAHVLESGQRSIEHLGGYASGGAQLDAQVAATVSAGTYNCPTLAIQEILNPGFSADTRRLIVRALSRGGARLLVGTDAGIDQTRAGSSINDELDLFVRSGLTPYQALLGATRTAAEYLGEAARIGAISEGMNADLILLRSNPLQNIRATRSPVAVIYRGRVL
jgi:imidazolonepropionase-like amidohydrolase